MRAITTLALTLASTPAAAQSVLYDAGPAGTPPTTPSPVLQGWSELVSGSCAAGGLSPDPGTAFNAWQIHDPQPGRVRYGKNIVWVGTDFDAVLVMQALAGTIQFEIDTGDLITDSIFDLELEVVGADVHVHHGGPTPIICTGAVDGGYHEYRFSGRLYALAFRYDGTYLGVVDETRWGLATYHQGLRWGTSHSGYGRARVHRAEMTLSDWAPIGTSYCGPAAAHSGGVPARIEAEGDVSWTADGLRIFARDLPAQAFGYFLVSRTQDYVVQPGLSQGNLCLGGNIGRYVGTGQVQSSGASGRIWIDVDLQNIPTTPPSSVMGGDTWNFQAWFRDANPAVTSNFTDGVSITY